MRILLALAALPLAACHHGTNDDGPGVPGHGTGRARSYQVADFVNVTARGADAVDVRVGAGFSVRAEGDSDDLDLLSIRTAGDTLQIGRRDRYGFSWGGHSVKVFVTMPRIAQAALAGSGDMAIDRAEGASFQAKTAGAGTITVGALTVDDARFSVAGSGGVTARGTAKAVKVNIAGSGDVDGAGLKAAGAEVAVAGSGSVKLDVTGDAMVSIMGSGDVDLGQNAKCRVTKHGSGEVHCGH